MISVPVFLHAGGGVPTEKSGTEPEQSFEDWLKLEAESVTDSKSKDLKNVDVLWLRKSINTDLSKIKSRVGSKKTLLLAINRKLERLKELSERDYLDMQEKVKKTV